MTTCDACEQAYKNGYDKGYAAALAAAGVHFVEGCSCTSNVKVFGLEDSIRGAKFPMATDISHEHFLLPMYFLPLTRFSVRYT